MVIFDANVLITYLSSNQEDVDYLRLVNLVEELTSQKKIVGVPTPSWAEFLVKTDEATKDLVDMVNKNPSIKILPFDKAAAVESSLILRSVIASEGNKRGGNDATWQKIKFDRQILAIARVNNAEILYTNDGDLIKEANRINLKTCRTEDLPLPQLQSNINFEQN